MMKFFRKKRQKLMHELSLKRYLLYALGEIFLVMVGILLALQVNNWNEWRKDRIKEKIILNELANNVALNIRTLENDLDLLQTWNRSSGIVIRTLENKMEYSDTLRRHFHLARVTKQNLFLSNIGYQSYKNEAWIAESIRLYQQKLSNCRKPLFQVLYPLIIW